MDATASHAEQSTKVMPGTVLFTAVRNEAPFLIEWIAYHKVIGFERIVIYENDSTDGTETLLARLAQAGEVEFVRHTPPPDLRPQNAAARLANRSGHFVDGDWIIWLDIDEFLNIKTGDGSVGALLSAAPQAEAFVLNWRTFGVPENEIWPPRLVSPSYNRAAKRINFTNRGVKTIFRRGNVFSGVSESSPHRPPVIEGAKLDLAACFNGNGYSLKPGKINDIWALERDTVKIWLNVWDSKPEDWGFGLAQVNHYAVRSATAFLLKRKRGTGMSFAAESYAEATVKYSAGYYSKHNRREVEETSILRHEAATNAEMERLRALPGVAEAEAEALRLTAAMIAAIPPEEFAALSGVQQPEAAPRTAT